MLKEVKVRCFERQPFVRVIGGIVGCVWVEMQKWSYAIGEYDDEKTRIRFPSVAPW